MRAEIIRGTARGEVRAPGSKSIAHRLLIAAAMCDGGVSTVRGVTPSADILATADCLRALGATVTSEGDTFTVVGTDMRKTAPRDTLFCRESGSTLRFIIPIATLSGARVHLSGAKRLMQRPLSVYEELYSERELLFKKIGDLLFVDGPLPSGEYVVPGNVSSQFISGLMFALPTLESESVIKITPPFESSSYIKLTVSALAEFGITVEFVDELTIKIPGSQKYRPRHLTVEGDFSGAAFPDALNMLGSQVRVLGLSESSEQGDRVYRELYAKLENGAPEINIEDCPDLAPILFALAAYLNGATFHGTRRLRIKESDRASAMAEELAKLGAELIIEDNTVVVKKAALHAPDVPISSHNDHRIVMAMAVLLTKFGGVIEGAEAVSKSYPDFFSDIASLGIEVELYD